MTPQILKDLLQLVGGGAMMVIVSAIILYWLKIIPSEAVTGFIAWTLGGASVGTLLGLLYQRISSK